MREYVDGLNGAEVTLVQGLQKGRVSWLMPENSEKAQDMEVPVFA